MLGVSTGQKKPMSSLFVFYSIYYNNNEKVLCAFCIYLICIDQKKKKTDFGAAMQTSNTDKPHLLKGRPW